MKARRPLFRSGAHARRAGLEILARAPSVWTRLQSCGFQALRGAGRASGLFGQWLAGKVLALLAVLAIVAAISLGIAAISAAVPVFLVVLVFVAIWWRLQR